MAPWEGVWARAAPLPSLDLACPTLAPRSEAFGAGEGAGASRAGSTTRLERRDGRGLREGTARRTRPGAEDPARKDGDRARARGGTEGERLRRERWEPRREGGGGGLQEEEMEKRKERQWGGEGGAALTWAAPARGARSKMTILRAGVFSVTLAEVIVCLSSRKDFSLKAFEAHARTLFLTPLFIFLFTLLYSFTRSILIPSVEMSHLGLQEAV